METERLFRAQSLEGTDRIVRVHVLLCHKPARLIGPDRQKREIDTAMPCGDAAEDPSVAKGGVAGEVDGPPARFNHEARP